MKIEVRGKNGFEVTTSIKNYVEDRLLKLEKYFKEELEGHVVCKTYRDHQKVEVTIPTKFFTMRAEVRDPDMYAAIDLSVDKLEAQIRKNKQKITRSLQKKESASLFFDNEDFDIKALERELISPVKTKSIELSTMSVEEAITSLEMLDHDFYIFRDEKTNKVSVVYVRLDNQYGVIETV